MYIARIKHYDPTLHFVVTILEDRALAKAKEADAEIAAGNIAGLCTGFPGAPRTCLR